MADNRIWTVGLSMVLVWLILGFSFEVWTGWIGVSPALGRRLLAFLLTASAFYVAYSCRIGGFVKSTALLLPAVTLGPIFNLLLGNIGYPTDFRGLDGIMPSFWIFLASGLFSILPGAALGAVLRWLVRTGQIPN